MRLSKKGKSLAGLLLLLITALPALAQPGKHVIIGYVGGFHGLIDTTMVHAKKLTHINYAFVNVKNNRAFLTNIKTDTTNFKNLVKLKKDNPKLKVLISIGGWAWSKNFSDAVLTDTSRTAFAASAVDIVRKYHLDGVDIDWEYPNDIGDGNVFRSADKQNYTLMFKALRKELNKLEKETGNKMFLTAAVGGFKRFTLNTEMDKVARYLNYINLMSYDYFQDSLHISVHHTNLYGSKKYNPAFDSGDKAVNDFMTAGVPAKKLVLGVAFYGHSSRVIDTTANGLGIKTDGKMRAGGYTFIKDSLVDNPASGLKYYRDLDAGAPYLFNPVTRQFITYDDEWSIKNKCDYVNRKKLAGVMFWEYSSDKKEYLLDEIDRDLK
ncbi:glycoside hydrolase family 18 protein [Mucilaginibacter sp. L3T2-6]|uniref:glycoside hydrolase family 18 protein n=1 Tax=Mucilaginibacter sp. L3T2-6 TaxID=3062491 RepID=UPI0026751496|nr:glycoside hydrolase family 18 protein [Mucilaginibacter sp. L3T2-6]MDO3642371.1 glycoside hydrolase family 18 protein [Mucilaginibacter sp. L3T2-6]MDV6214866.1 glycoside hydrolase family 18 protein [Mucilaginibacter sp. L3T2-6]